MALRPARLGFRTLLVNCTRQCNARLSYTGANEYITRGASLPIIQPRQQQCRHLNKYRKVEQEVSPLETVTAQLDEKINSRFVHYVDPDDKFWKNMELKSLIRQTRNSTQRAADRVHLRKTGIGPDGLPIVRRVTWSTLQREAQDITQQAQARKRKARAEEPKEIQVNWGIDVYGDLQHKLKQLKEWLQEGKKVEVKVITKPGTQRRPTRDEKHAVLEHVRDAVNSIDGASEWKSMEGALGVSATLHFRGPNIDDAAASEGTESKDNASDTASLKRQKKEERKEELARKEERRAKERAEKEEHFKQRRKELLGQL